MDIVRPFSEEWSREMTALAKDINVQVSAEEMLSLYSVVHVVLGTHLEINPHIDYDDCFRAKGCARAIFCMGTKEKLAARAYVNLLKTSHDLNTQWMGKNIEEELLKIFMTGIIPKTPEEFYRELQNEEQKQGLKKDYSAS